MAKSKQHQPQNSNQQNQFGNQDSEKRFTIPDDWRTKVVVYQCNVEVMNGGMFEVPNTHKLQTYEPATYDKMTESFFSESKMKIIVLHDPRLEVEPTEETE